MPLLEDGSALALSRVLVIKGLGLVELLARLGGIRAWARAAAAAGPSPAAAIRIALRVAPPAARAGSRRRPGGWAPEGWWRRRWRRRPRARRRPWRGRRRRRLWRTATRHDLVDIPTARIAVVDVPRAALSIGLTVIANVQARRPAMWRSPAQTGRALARGDLAKAAQLAVYRAWLKRCGGRRGRLRRRRQTAGRRRRRRGRRRRQTARRRRRRRRRPDHRRRRANRRWRGGDRRRGGGAAGAARAA